MPVLHKKTWFQEANVFFFVYGAQNKIKNLIYRHFKNPRQSISSLKKIQKLF